MNSQPRPAPAQFAANVLVVILLLVVGLNNCDGNSNNNDRPVTPTPSLTPTPTPSPSPSPTPQASVQLGTLGIPAMWMAGPGKKPETVLSIGPGPDNCPVGIECRKFTYKKGAGWAGILWWPSACGPSGTNAAAALAKSGVCGVNVPQRGNLKSVDRLSFYARAEKDGAVIGFQVGADDMPPRKVGPYWVKLTTEWKRQEIDLKGVDLTNAVALFIWLARDEDNPDGAVFYMDDAKFEGTK
jgi:hypothetical protein